VLSQSSCALHLQVKRIEAHKSAVNEICFDEAVEYIASCSDDGTVAVSPAHALAASRDSSMHACA
jgi:WD40 repeat protein